MKKYVFKIVTALMILALLTGCGNSGSDRGERMSDPEKNEIGEGSDLLYSGDRVFLPCSKDNVKEFLGILGDIEGGGLLSGASFSEEDCYNVTPEAVSQETDIKIFKFGGSCASFVLIDGEAYPVCTFFGGYGFHNALFWDYDGDGTKDLLIASSWGSGVHRSVLEVFNVTTKETVLLATSTDINAVGIAENWIVSNEPPESYEDDETDGGRFFVYAADLFIEDYNFARLSYVPGPCVLSVSYENGEPSLQLCEGKRSGS